MKKLIITLTLLLSILIFSTQSTYAYKSEPAGEVGSWHVIEGNRAYVHYKFPMKSSYYTASSQTFSNRTSTTNYNKTITYNGDYSSGEKNIFGGLKKESFNYTETVYLEKHFTQLQSLYMDGVGAFYINAENPDKSKYSNLVIELKTVDSVNSTAQNLVFKKNVIYSGNGDLVNLAFDFDRNHPIGDMYFTVWGTNPTTTTVYEFPISNSNFIFQQDNHLKAYTIQKFKELVEFEKLMRIYLGDNKTHEIMEEYISFLQPSISIYWEEAKTYSLSFNSNGGTAVNTISFRENILPVRPQDPTRTGYKFVGWYKNQTLTDAYQFTTNLTTNTTLYAKWEELPSTSRTVTYRTNGGSNVGTTIFEVGTVPQMPGEPTRAGYTFLGWFKDFELTTPYLFNQSSNVNLTLYAKWEQVTLPVRLIYGSQEQIVYVKYGNSLPPTQPVIENFTFIGWYTDAEFTNKFDANGPITADMNLYGRYVANDKRIVNFNSMGGTEIEFQEVFNMNKLTYVEPSKADYTFDGWYESYTYVGSEFDFNQPISKDMTLYAKWIQIGDEQDLDNNNNNNNNNGGNNNNNSGGNNNASDESGFNAWFEKNVVWVLLAIVVAAIVFAPKKRYGKRSKS